MSFADELKEMADKENYLKTSEGKVAEINRVKEVGQKRIWECFWRSSSNLINRIPESCRKAAKEGKMSINFVIEGVAMYEYDQNYFFRYYSENDFIPYMESLNGGAVHPRFYIDIFGHRILFNIQSGYGQDPITESEAEYVLYYLFVFEEETAKEIEKKLIKELSEQGLNVKVSTYKSPTWYLRKPTGKFLDKKRKVVQFPQDHYAFKVDISW